jgi:hypothetical protein
MRKNRIIICRRRGRARDRGYGYRRVGDSLRVDKLTVSGTLKFPPPLTRSGPAYPKSRLCDDSAFPMAQNAPNKLI